MSTGSALFAALARLTATCSAVKSTAHLHRDIITSAAPHAETSTTVVMTLRTSGQLLGNRPDTVPSRLSFQSPEPCRV